MQQFVDTRDFLSQTKFYEGYSRFKDGHSRYESWDEAVDRVIEMHDKNYMSNGNELTEYLDDPSDEKKEDLNKKLRTLLKELCLMPEYYLS